MPLSLVTIIKQALVDLLILPVHYCDCTVYLLSVTFVCENVILSLNYIYGIFQAVPRVLDGGRVAVLVHWTHQLSPVIFTLV